MIYKKIDVTSAVMARVSEDTAKEFIDHRINMKKPLTQGAFDRAMGAAVKCELHHHIPAQEAIEITIDNGWQGVKPEFIVADLSRRTKAAIETSSLSTRQPTLAQDLNDTSWAD